MVVEAWNPVTNEVRWFPQPCDVPAGWISPVPDTDGDGWRDPEEIDNGSDLNDPNSVPPDADRDHVGDFTDNCPLINNPDQVDTDADGIGDACDMQTDCSISTRLQMWNSVTGARRMFTTACVPEDWRYGLPDTDQDGFLDYIEVENSNNPEDSADQPGNIDGDLLADTRDADMDGDGPSNSVDNCPFVANADQVDTDGDGLGDACDDQAQVCNETPTKAWNLFTGEIQEFPTSCVPGGWSIDFESDKDGDGWSDLIESQLILINTNLFVIARNAAITPVDIDGDGIPNDEDNCPNVYDKSQLDENNNGTGDYCESSSTRLPSLTAPADITMEASGALTPLNLGIPKVSSDGIVWPDQFGPFTVGEHIVTWTAAGFYNNRVTDTQVVNITDTTAPQVTAPEDIAFDEGAGITFESLGSANATDSVDGQLTPQVQTDLSSLVIGENEVIWSATDNAGNTGQDTQIVTINDKTPPQVTAPANIAFDEGTVITVDMLGVAMATDSHDGVLIPQVETDLSSLVVGNNEVLWVATDNAGNTGSAIQIVTINTVPSDPVDPPGDNPGDTSNAPDGSNQSQEPDSGGGSAGWLTLLMIIIGALRFTEWRFKLNESRRSRSG